jgi:multidrug efflux pump subunit AcrA (membrane-fusion protein)
MLRKGLIGICIFSQVLLICFMAFIIHSKDTKQEIMEDLFVKKEDLNREVCSLEEISNKVSNVKSVFSVPYKSFIEAKGVVVPSSGYIYITNPIEGKVSDVFVKVGDLVEESSPLFKICDNCTQVLIKEKEASLNKWVAKLKFLQNGASAFAKLKVQKEIEEIEILKKNQEKEVLIFQNLLEKSAISALESEEKGMNLQITEKSLEKAKAKYDELNAKMTSDEEDIYLNKIEEKKAKLKLAALGLEKTIVKSPVAARVIDVDLCKGQYLNDKGYKYITLASENPTVIKVSVEENEAYKIVTNKKLRAVAVHPENDEIYFILDFAYFNPRMSIYKDGSKKLDLFFTLNKEGVPLYFEQSLKVYIETSSLNDLSFLHYQFNN